MPQESSLMNFSVLYETSKSILARFPKGKDDLDPPEVWVPKSLLEDFSHDDETGAANAYIPDWFRLKNGI